MSEIGVWCQLVQSAMEALIGIYIVDGEGGGASRHSGCGRPGLV